jgi:hypothetical protein
LHAHVLGIVVIVSGLHQNVMVHVVLVKEFHMVAGFQGYGCFTESLTRLNDGAGGGYRSDEGRQQRGTHKNEA